MDKLQKNYPNPADLPYPSDYNPTDWVKSVVGSKYKAWNGETYKCIGYNPRIGFWMENVEDKSDVRNVSERAINRTYHKIHSK